MTIVELDRALKSACPVYGVSIGDPNDKGTWRVDFMPEASSIQMAAANSVISSAPTPLDIGE